MNIQNSDYLSTTTGVQVVAHAGVVYRVILNGFSNAATISLYDGTDASGSPFLVLQAGTNSTQALDLAQGFRFDTGLYAVVTGTNAKANVHHG